MRVLSLFSGIGGIDLGLERAGHTVVAQSEVDPYCCRVLAKHWPDIPNLGDASTIDWNEHHELRADIIAGGYPCQPFSYAGRRGGDRDPRHLWPLMADAIRVLRPRYAVMENVAGHLSLGFGQVLGDLAEIGYDAQWDCIPAAAVGAPHRRDRVWVIAYPHGESEPERAVDAFPRSGVMVPDAERIELRDESGRRYGAGRADQAIARDDGAPQSVADTEGVTKREPSDETNTLTGSRQTWPVPSGGGWWEPEPDVGRVAHGVPHRVDRLRGLGNAVVPQVAEHIGRMLAVA